MKNTKFIKILKLLSNKKLIKLKDFINIPYFNKDKKIGELIEYLLEYAPTYEVTKEECFQKIYPNSVYDSLKWRRLSSKTFKLIEQFIAHEELEAKPNIKHRVLAEFYERNVEPTLFEKHSNAWEDSTKKLLFNIRLTELFLIKWQRWFFACLLDEKQIRSKKSKTEEELLNDLWTSFEDLVGRLTLDFFVMQEEYKYVTSFGSIKFKQSFLMESVLKAIKENEAEFSENINIYQVYLQYKLLMDNNDQKALNGLIKIRDTQSMQLHKRDVENICLAINLYYIRSFNKTLDLKNIEGRFDNLLFRLKHNLAFREGFIIHHHFMNIVQRGLELNKIDFIENFIEEYTDQLAVAYKIPIGNLARALLAFFKRDFEKVIPILRSFTVNKNFFYYMRMRQLQIKTYYELGNYEMTDNLINAFRVVVSRSKGLSEASKIRGQGFINVIYHLIYFTKADPKKIAKLKNLKKSINEKYSDPLWLLEKIEEKLNP